MFDTRALARHSANCAQATERFSNGSTTRLSYNHYNNNNSYDFDKGWNSNQNLLRESVEEPTDSTTLGSYQSQSYYECRWTPVTASVVPKITEKIKLKCQICGKSFHPKGIDVHRRACERREQQRIARELQDSKPKIASRATGLSHEDTQKVLAWINNRDPNAVEKHWQKSEQKSKKTKLPVDIVICYKTLLNVEQLSQLLGNCLLGPNTNNLGGNTNADSESSESESTTTKFNSTINDIVVVSESESLSSSTVQTGNTNFHWVKSLLDFRISDNLLDSLPMANCCPRAVIFCSSWCNLAKAFSIVPMVEEARRREGGGRWGCFGPLRLKESGDSEFEFNIWLDERHLNLNTRVRFSTTNEIVANFGLEKPSKDWDEKRNREVKKKNKPIIDRHCPTMGACIEAACASDLVRSISTFSITADRPGPAKQTDNGSSSEGIYQ